jgi:hypothetical protein
VCFLFGHVPKFLGNNLEKFQQEQITYNITGINWVGKKMIIEITVDGKIWLKLDVKDQLGAEAIKELESVYQNIVNSKNKDRVNSSLMETRAVHQLRKKYG